MFAAHVLLTLGALTGIASLAALWSSVGFRNYPPYEDMAVLTTSTVFTYIGLLGLVLPAAVMAAVSAVQLRRVAVGGVLPGAVRGCAPSAPAIQGCAWAGTAFFLVSGLAGRLLTAYDTPLDAFGATCLVCGCVLTSVAGCCVMGAVPGLGAARSNPCCVAVAGEEEADDLLPSTASAGVSVRTPDAPNADAPDAEDAEPPPRTAWAAAAKAHKDAAAAAPRPDDAAADSALRRPESASL